MKAKKTIKSLFKRGTRNLTNWQSRLVNGVPVLTVDDCTFGESVIVKGRFLVGDEADEVYAELFNLAERADDVPCFRDYTRFCIWEVAYGRKGTCWLYVIVDQELQRCLYLCSGLVRDLYREDTEMFYGFFG